MTLSEIRDEARHAACRYCGASPDQPCDCCPSGVHYARVAACCRAGYIDLTDFGEAIHDDVFTGGDVFDPVAGAGSLKWAAEAAELRSSPKRWALLAELASPARARAMAAHIRRGELRQFRPAGSFEATQRGCKVYARYVGDEP